MPPWIPGSASCTPTRHTAPNSPGLETRVVEHSYATLKTAVDNAWDAWRALGRDEKLVGVGLDVINNEVDVHVESADLERALEAERALSGALGVPVEMSGGEAVQTTACGSRESCTGPMKAGIVIHEDSLTGPRCTMAFHVRYGSDEQFVTAEHCGTGGAGGTQDRWFHQGLPDFGHVEQENELRQNGFDRQRVQLRDAQASTRIYGLSSVVGNWTWPMVGSAAGVSAGRSDRVVWNVVRNDYYTYGIDGVTVRGARMDSTPGGAAGDSGSPVFHLMFARAYAVGTGSGTVTINGVVYDVFARFGDAAAEWGITPVSE